MDFEYKMINYPEADIHVVSPENVEDIITSVE